jgi:hypothetical protein
MDGWTDGPVYDEPAAYWIGGRVFAARPSIIRHGAPHLVGLSGSRYMKSTPVPVKLLSLDGTMLWWLGWRERLHPV